MKHTLTPAQIVLLPSALCEALASYERHLEELNGHAPASAAYWRAEAAKVRALKALLDDAIQIDVTTAITPATAEAVTVGIQELQQIEAELSHQIARPPSSATCPPAASGQALPAPIAAPDTSASSASVEPKSAAGSNATPFLGDQNPATDPEKPTQGTSDQPPSPARDTASRHHPQSSRAQEAPPRGATPSTPSAGPLQDGQSDHPSPDSAPGR